MEDLKTKFLSRKFLAFVVTFVTLVSQGLFTEAGVLAVGYFGIQGYVDAQATKAKALAKGLQDRLDVLEGLLAGRKGGDI